MRALIGATPEAGLEEVALGRAFEACAAAVAKAVPELSEVLVRREIALSSG